MRNNHRLHVSIFFVFVFSALPTVAQGAGLRVSQIMYDPVGNNVGRQWVQIVNTGAESVNIAGYKLFQNGVNHGISVISGTTTLAAGEIGIVASKPNQFLAEYPYYASALFKASYTLRVAGDTLTLKDSKLNVVDTVVYGSVEGASGDGNALYWSQGTWVPGAPDPGSYHAVPSPAIAKAPSASPPTVKVLKSTDKKANTKVIPDVRPRSDMSEPDTVATGVDGERGGLAAVVPSGTSPSLIMEIVTGFAAVVVVIVASVLLSTRFMPQQIPVTEQPKTTDGPAKKLRSEADEYDIIDSPDIFLRH